jgi:transposase-like protein
MKIGGVGEIVEIDEAKFGKRKFNRGRRVQGQWAVGGVQRNPRKFFFVLVDSRCSNVLHQIIKDYVLPGSIIFTDCWKGYMGLENLGYTHKTVNHSKEFISSDGTHTQTIESTWRALKGFHLPRSGCRKQFYFSYLMEYAYRKQFFTESDQDHVSLFWTHVATNHALGKTSDIPSYTSEIVDYDSDDCGVNDEFPVL